MTFSAVENILVPRGEESLTALISTNFKNLRQVGLEASDSEQEQVAEEVAEESSQSKAEVDEALKIAEIGRRQHDAIEQIAFLKIEVESEKSKAVEASQRDDSEAAKAVEGHARADSEAESARNSDQLRLAAKNRAKASEDALQLAKEVIAKLEADLEESKKAKEKVDFEVSKAFQARQEAALESYAEEVPKFEN
ncbi:uncharacterized protein LOC114268540 [Camellia sinensis]|uniref:uncharacterized protein LOC114268540 n=1 Tax=Camellia sinensis TaxID=4442 RepID=UPI0010369EF3|nr:uncharacterized protein LOC114268540 [Camellia sinensis]